MRYLAIDQNGEALPEQVRDYLRRCGLSERKISRCNRATRMYHDLGLYGDVAEACMEVLSDEFRVDLTGFEFERFFPPEFTGRTMLSRVWFWAIPFAAASMRKRTQYGPLELERIGQAIAARRWI